MFRTKTLAILALMLFTLVTPVMATHADDEVESVGTANIQDDLASSDSVVISLTGIPQASDGSNYNAYLESGDGSSALNLGSGTVELPVVHGVIQSTGSLKITFDSTSAGYDGSNLLEIFSRMKITEEPSGTVFYSDALSGTAVSELKAMLDDVIALNAALDDAISSANSASSATETDAINANINAVIDSIDNVVSLSEQINTHASTASEAAPEENGIVDNISGIEAITSNISTWSSSVKDIAEGKIVTQTSPIVAQIFVTNVINQLSAARNGWDADNSGSISATAGEGGGSQAYSVGQSMASFTLTAGDHLPGAAIVVTPTSTPTPSTVEAHILGSLGLPSVGEKIIANMMTLALIAGISLVTGGGIILVRSKRS